MTPITIPATAPAPRLFFGAEPTLRASPWRSSASQPGGSWASLDSVLPVTGIVGERVFVTDARWRQTVLAGSVLDSSSDELMEEADSAPEVPASSEELVSCSWRRARRAARLSSILMCSQAWLRRRTVGPVTLMMSSSPWPPSISPSSISRPHKQWTLTQQGWVIGSCPIEYNVQREEWRK